MALVLTDLVSGAAFGDGTQLWKYTSADTLATVLGSGYFNGAATLLKVGDTIVIQAATMDIAKVATNAGGTVTTTRAALS